MAKHTNKFDDLTGRTFSRLTVLYRDINREEELKQGGNKKPATYWMCECTCGTVRSFARRVLIDGSASSCGCYKRELHTKHGGKGTRLYSIWLDMRRRCNNPSRPDFYLYGGRGIQVCPTWNDDFEAFKNWSISNGYEEHLTIDRKDNNGDYSPSNCRWVSRKVQANNTRNNIRLTLHGRTQTLAQWAQEAGLAYTTLMSRYKKGIRGEEILLSPALYKKKKKKIS